MARRVGDNGAPVHPAKDSEPSSYFSLSEAVPSTLRSHSGSMDVTDVAYAPRMTAFSRRGETLLEDRLAEDGDASADYNPADDDTTSDEGSPIARQSHLDHHLNRQRLGETANADGDGGADGGGMMDLEDGGGVGGEGGDVDELGPGIALGGGLEESGGGVEEVVRRGERAGGVGLEPLELPRPPTGPNASGGKPEDDVEESPRSSPLGQGPGLQAIAFEAAESGKASPSLSVGAGGTGAGALSLGGGGPIVDGGDFSASGGPRIWRDVSAGRENGGGSGGGGGGGGGGVSVGAGGGIDSPAVREMRADTADSTSSDESMAGNARLSAPAMKRQWEEAMSGGNTPETPHRSRRGSTSIDGSVGRGVPGNLFSPCAARGLGSSFGPVEGVVTRTGRAGSVNGVGGSGVGGVGGGSLSLSGGSIGAGLVGGGGGGGGASISVLGTHLRTYGWVRDEEVSECMNACGTEFTTLERRHHCRCCGAIFCQNCSRHRCLVPEPVTPPGKDPLDPTRPHRVCNACYADVQASQEELLSKVSKARRHNAFNTDSAARHCNPPFGLDLAHEVRKSANTLNNILERRQGCDCEGMNLMLRPEQRISQSLCRGAIGLVFVTIAKAGFLYAAEAGTGLCVARLPDGNWSAPAAVQMFGLSWGLQAGCEVVDVVIPLRSDAAVEMLKCGGQAYANLDAAVAVGPMGRSVGSAVGGRSWPGEAPAVDFAARYSLSKGLFAGFGVGAGFLRVADRVNERFYGAQVSPRNLLGGLMPRPPAANPLYSSLGRLENITRK